jgi:hypothetical protein
MEVPGSERATGWLARSDLFRRAGRGTAQVHATLLFRGELIPSTREIHPFPLPCDSGSFASSRNASRRSSNPRPGASGSAMNPSFALGKPV